MPTNRKVIDFKIHNLTEEQFQELKEAGQIDPNAIYCTPDETVANFEAVNARIDTVDETVNARIDEANKNLNTVDKKVDEAIKTEQQHNIEINARVDETVANFEEINTEIEALKDKAGITSEQLNNKADVSSVQALETRTGILEQGDYVVASQKPTSANGYTWFRKYKSGWVEQGGRQYGELTAVYGEAISFGLITLPVPMSNGNSYYAGAIGNGYTCLMNVHPSATTIKFDFGAYTTNRTLTQVRWFVSGYAA